VTLEKLHKHIDKKLPAEEVEFVKKFAQVLYQKATPDFLEEFDPESLLAIALGAVKLVHPRGDEIRVRVFNPSYEAEGWQSSYTAVEIALVDRPFIVDTVRAELKRQGLKVHYFLHPILYLKRNPDGTMQRSLDKDEYDIREAYELYLVDRVDDPARLEQIGQRVTSVLRDVLKATDDYQLMKDKAAHARDYLGTVRERLDDEQKAADVRECEQFMDWLAAGNFTFLGYSEYNIIEHAGEPHLQLGTESGLGILRGNDGSSYSQPVKLADIPENLRARVIGGPLLIVTKANSEATVHRPVRMDYVGIKKWNSANLAQGEIRFLGLFTSHALSTPVREIPILRRKLARVLEIDNAIEGSHDYKQIVSIFNSMPREELFWSEADSLQKDIRAIMAVQRQHKVRLTLRPDPLARGLQAMVVMPRDRFNTEVRNQIQEMLSKRFEASHVDYHLSLGEEEDQARFHFFFITDKRLQNLEDLAELEAEVADITRTWGDRLQEKLTAAHGEIKGPRLAEAYAPAFDEGYRATTSLGSAVRDIDNLERLRTDDVRFLVDLVNALEDSNATQLRIVHRGNSLVLSDVLPVLENLGMKILVQDSHRVRMADKSTFSIDVFRVQDKQTSSPLNVREDGERLVQALVGLLEGRAQNDRLNGLVISTNLDWRKVALLRSYQVHFHQINPAASRHFLNDTMLDNPLPSQKMYEYFEAMFKPGLADREELRKKVREEFFESLNAVSSLASDRTLRDMFNLVESTVRTNYFLDKPYISHKVSSHLVKTMPEPRPLFEISVVSPGVEGIHLRGGKVARGGLRWSDRPDFRTEVLGLMKTQMTKNAVIVPVGSKGGFALKHPPKDRAELMTHVVEQYKTYLRGLLDLTDNIVSGKVVQPEGLVIYDQEDPYLVVAADKGTATFSNFANSVSLEYGFWLGDAFASGGSAGYDHKKEGITARGAWEGVKRHFREMSVDVLSQEVTVAGIGDLAGDVFGNGLIYCDTLRLQAAFNHLHIFLDPNPDAKTSYQERLRMFNLPRSSWEDYDKSLISQGGGIFLRSAKSIPLSPEVQAMLAVEDDALSGEDLIKAILRMPVDLLWNGGIGTYVKAASERNADVGDSSNDSVRVNANELRCRVVGEGGNQGFTQLGRIEYARAGGRINTDAIDNSAGVDMSDHEVNIKILLGPLMTSGDLSESQRNKLLEEMTDEVCKLVLKDNYTQTLCLSLSQRRSEEDLPLFVSLMDYLAERGGLRTDVEYLPDRKALAERMRNGEGFTRPELAILLAYTKMGLYRRILETDFPDEPYFQHHLVEYFPRQLQEQYADRMHKHPLRREIIATQFTNTVVDLLGITFVHRTIRDTGATPIQVIRAALLALEIVDVREFLNQLAEFDTTLPSEGLYDAQREMITAVENVVNWMLLTDVDLSSIEDFVKIYREPLGKLRRELGDLLPGQQLGRYHSFLEKARETGFPEDVAREVASFDWVPSGLGVIDTMRRADLGLEEAARRYYELGERFSLGWLRDNLRHISSGDKWETIALVGLIMDLRQVQLDMVLSNHDFPSVEGGLVHRYDTALAEIRATNGLSLSSGDVLARMLSQMAQGAHSHDPRTRTTEPVLPGVASPRKETMRITRPKGPVETW